MASRRLKRSCMLLRTSHRITNVRIAERDSNIFQIYFLCIANTDRKSTIPFVCSLLSRVLCFISVLPYQYLAVQTFSFTNRVKYNLLRLRK